MPIHALPDIFTNFRKQVEKFSEVRESLETPSTFNTSKVVDAGKIPSLQELGLEDPIPDDRRAIYHKGGEVEALERLQTYFWEEDRLKEYK